MELASWTQSYGGCRVSSYNVQPPLFNDPGDTEKKELDAQLNYEIPAADWQAITPDVPPNFRPNDWDGAPVRFVDGKDVGDTILWLQPQGYPAPVRLSQIGATVIEVQNGECRRVYHATDKVVSLVTDAFPWHEIEDLANALAEHGFRLLPASPEKGLSSDYEKMRKAAQNRSNFEMSACALAQMLDKPIVIDGRLEPRNRISKLENTPAFGVIKTHRENYLHAKGLQLLYRLDCAQRTPAFSITTTCDDDGEVHEVELPVISWYLKLCGGKGSLPNTGYVRVEVTRAWLEKNHPDEAARRRFYDYLSRTLYDYRCRDSSYGRAAISLEPIVRAEEKLGALFQPSDLIASRFCRLMGV
jgi:hypothetical protein